MKKEVVLVLLLFVRELSEGMGLGNLHDEKVGSGEGDGVM